MKKRLFIITGEYSGDIHAAKVVKELRYLTSDVEIEGIGGMNLSNEGVKLFADQKNMWIKFFVFSRLKALYMLNMVLILIIAVIHWLRSCLHLQENVNFLEIMV